MLDYLITEAVYLKVAHEDEKIKDEAEEKAKREAEKNQWKKESFEKLNAYR